MTMQFLKNKYFFCAMPVLLSIVLSLSIVVSPVHAAKKDWKRLYLEYLENMQEDVLKKTFPEGKFIYINNDDIPEIFLKGTDAATGNRLLIIYNDKVHEYFLDGHGSLRYLEKKNRYYTSGGHMDTYFDSVGKLSKGKMDSIASGYYGAKDNSNVKFDKNGQPIYIYYWNDKKVSKKTYQKKLNSVLGKNRDKYKEAYSYGKMDTIKEILKNLN